jgi:integrase
VDYRTLRIAGRKLTVTKSFPRPRTAQSHFWNGRSKPKSLVGNYQKSLALVFEAAGVPPAYPHLFKHTFASVSLQHGVPLEFVSQVLRHSTIKMTERRYTHWMKGRQEQLEEEFKKSWSRSDTGSQFSGPTSI